MIKIQDFSLILGDKRIFKNADIEIPNNKISVIVGPNGVGKTTLLKVVSGLIKVDNTNLKNDFKEIFYLPQKISYPKNISLFDYLSLSFFRNSFKWFISKAEKQKILNVLQELNMLDKKDIYIADLSSGEQQLANVALAMLSNSDCLLFDEPTSNMDLSNQITVVDIIRKLKEKNITCVLVMHDLNLAAKVGDFFIGINNNFEIVSQPKNSFFSEENLKKIFDLNFEVKRENEKIFVSVID